MKSVLKKTNIILSISKSELSVSKSKSKSKSNKVFHTSINYGDNIEIDDSNKSTIYHFLHCKNLSSTNLSQINN